MPDGPDSSFDFSPKEQKDLLLALLGRGNAGVFPLSLAQKRIWFLDQLEPENPAYNVPFGMRLRGRLNIDALTLAISEIAHRHAVLRTTFQVEDGNPVQVVGPGSSIPIPVLDLTALAHEIREAEAYRAAAAEIRIAFNLATGPLLRLKLIRLDAEEHILVCVMHHIVCDGWSLGIFARELASLYDHFNGRSPLNLVDLPIQYGDFAVWQQKWISGELLAGQLRYWKQRLAGAPPYLELPTDSPRPAQQTYDGTSQAILVPKELVHDLTAIGRAKQATLFMVMLAAFKVLIQSYTKADDIVVGIPAAGRNSVEVEELIGFFVNTLVLRTNLSGDPRFNELLLQLREGSIGAFANADLPFEKLVEELNPPRTLSHNPIFQIMFSCLKVEGPPQFGGLACSPYVVASGTSPFDLSMNFIEEAEGGSWLRAEYNTSLFSAGRIRQLLRDYSTLLTAVAAQPELRISELASLLHAEEPKGQGSTGPPAESSSPISPATEVTPAASGAAQDSNDPDKPRDAQQQILVRLWERILGVSGIGIHDDFFELGGHSLLAARLISEVQNVLGCKVPLSTLFRSSTIDSFSEVVREGKTSAPDPLLMEVQAGAGGSPVFGIAAPGVDTLGYALLARHMGLEQPFYKLQADAPIMFVAPYSTEQLQKLAREYIPAMRAIQPQGPYFLIAACGGVHIAEQMVLELEAQGHKVGLLAVIDTWVLENRQVRWLERINYYSQRLRYLARLPIAAQFTSYKDWTQKHLRNLLRGDVVPVNPWARAYWPGKGFQPPRFDAPVLLFKRPRQPYYYVKDPEMGWGQRSSKPVEVVPVDAAHEAMLREPSVQKIGEKLGGRMHRMGDEFRKDTAQAKKPADFVWKSSIW